MMELFCYKATCIEVIDGDTVDLDVDLGFDVHTHVRVRLAGLNTPEIFGVPRDSESYLKGLVARDFVTNKLRGAPLQVKTVKDRKEKYGRYLAEVFLVDEKTGALTSINQVLLHEKLAEPYDGTGKVK